MTSRIDEVLKAMRTTDVSPFWETTQILQLQTSILRSGNDNKWVSFDNIGNKIEGQGESLSLQPIVMSTISQLKKRAKMNYAKTSEVKKIRKLSNKFGGPSDIFTELIADIKKEEETRVSIAAPPHHRDIHTSPGSRSSAGILDTSSIARSLLSAGSRRPSKRVSMLVRTSFDENTSDTHGVAGPDSGVDTFNSFESWAKRASRFDLNSPSRGSIGGFFEGSRRRSSGGFGLRERDEKLEAVKLARLELEQKREEEVVMKAKERAARLAAGRLTDIQHRQASWLVFAKLCQFIRNVVTDPLYQRTIKLKNISARVRQRKCQFALKSLISSWIRRYRIRQTLRNDSKVRNIMRVMVRRLWAVVRLNERRTTVSLLRAFVRETVAKNSFVKIMFQFRKRVMKVQLWAKSWVRVQKARMQLLWLAYEREEERQKKEHRDKIARNYRLAEGNIEKIEMFKVTVKQLKELNMGMHGFFDGKVKSLYKHYNSLERHTTASSGGATLTDNDSQYSGLLESLNIPSSGRGVRGAVVQGAMDSARPHSEGGLGAFQPPTSRGTRGWRKLSSANQSRNLGAGGTVVDKLRKVRALLQAQRRRQFLHDDEIERLSAKVSMVSINEVKVWLKDPHINATFNRVKKAAPVSDIPKRKRYSPFLLLTGGGLEALAALIASNRAQRITSEPLTNSSYSIGRGFSYLRVA